MSWESAKCTQLLWFESCLAAEREGHHDYDDALRVRARDANDARVGGKPVRRRG